MTDQHRREIIAFYNYRVNVTGCPKQAFIDARREWREKLGMRWHPFCRASLYLWAKRLGVRLLSSKIGTI